MVELRHNTKRRYSIDDYLKKLYESGVFNSPSQDASEQSVLRNNAVFLPMWSSKSTTIKKSRLRSPHWCNGSPICVKSPRRRWSRAGRRSYVCYSRRVVSCPFFRKISIASKPEKRVLISTAEERGELRFRSLLWQHGRWRTLVRRHDEANKPSLFSTSGFEARHPMTVSGQKNESSLK